MYLKQLSMDDVAYLLPKKPHFTLFFTPYVNAHNLRMDGGRLGAWATLLTPI